MADVQKIIKAVKSDETSYVAFENRSPRPVTIFWHNYKGKLVRYAVIKPGGVYQLDTFVTHPWSVADSRSGDKLLIDNGLIFYPRSQIQEDDVPTYEKIYIDLPVYPLWIRCLQVLRKKIPLEEVDSLHIPNNLKHALKSNPDFKFSTYSKFVVVNKWS